MLIFVAAAFVRFVVELRCIVGDGEMRLKEAVRGEFVETAAVLSCWCGSGDAVVVRIFNGGNDGRSLMEGRGRSIVVVLHVAERIGCGIPSGWW